MDEPWGHGFFSWLVLQFVAVNPVYPLILVAILPHKARMRLRAQYERELDERLRAAGIQPGRAADLSHPSTGTVGPSQRSSIPSSLAASSAPFLQLMKYGSPFAFGIIATTLFLSVAAGF